MTRQRASQARVNEGFLGYLGRRVATMYAASPVTDWHLGLYSRLLPGDDVEIVGYSESRGRVVLGTVTALEVARDLGDAAVGYVRELEAAERPLKLGRPAGLTTIESDDELWAAMDAARRAERPLRMRNVAAISGTFSYSALRGYLAVTHRTWADILDTFSARG